MLLAIKKNSMAAVDNCIGNNFKKNGMLILSVIVTLFHLVRMFVRDTWNDEQERGHLPN